MCTIVFRLPDYLIQDSNFVTVYRQRKSKDERKWIEELKEELVDEYGADDPDDFEFVCLCGKEVELSFEPDLT
jgi:hypothetical protein